VRKFIICECGGICRFGNSRFNNNTVVIVQCLECGKRIKKMSKQIPLAYLKHLAIEDIKNKNAYSQ